MKRNLENLNPEHYKAMETWIKLKRITAISRCPWHYIPGKDFSPYDSQLCKDIFPRLARTHFRMCICSCPCVSFSYKYVVATIKKILKENS